MSNKIGILDPEGINPNPLTNNPYSDKYKELAIRWSKYPVYEKADEIIQSLRDNQITLFSCDTGSGKTVLLPKFMLHVLNYKGSIAISLPKQMVTESAAEFAAKCLDVKLGEEVGYKFRGSNKKAISDKTKLLYATDGTIVAKLMNDPELKEYDAIIVDEIHERKINIDFLLYLLRNTCRLRPEFKLVLMSATVNEEIFANYFADFKFAYFNVKVGMNYPVESIFLSEAIDEKTYMKKGMDIVNNIIKTTNDGDILFFVSSIKETMDSCKIIPNDKNFCIEVYAGMDTVKQELAQDENKTKIRKVLIATNVAESSLTISNIKYVVDSGYELFAYYDPERKSRALVKKLISQSQVQQRLGRVGRTMPGICYHLYTKNDFDNIMEKFPLPAIKVSNIYGECLNLLTLNTIRTTDKLEDVLNDFIEPPNEKYVKDSILTLKQLGLIESNTISDLGKIIADLQLDPMHGLALYHAYRLNCAREVIAIISVIDVSKSNIGELFISLPPKIEGGDNNRLDQMTKKMTRAKKDLADKYGDHLTILKIFSKYAKLKKEGKDNTKLNDWIFKSFLKKDVLIKAYKHYQRIKGITLDKLSKLNKIKKTDGLDNHKLSTKILASFLLGFFLNTTSINGSNKNKLSKDSFLNFYIDDIISKQLMYNELITISNNTSISIVSKITKQVKELCDTILANSNDSRNSSDSGNSSDSRNSSVFSD